MGAWRGIERFEGRGQLRSWLYRIATHVCLDMLDGRRRRAMPLDMGPAGAPVAADLTSRPDAEWMQPMPDPMVVPEGDPADVALARETVRVAFVAALQHLPPRQRAALILCEVLRWSAAETAELLETTVASVNSALQRARATLAERGVDREAAGSTLTGSDAAMLERYVAAFEGYDMEALTALVHEDATQSMPPYALWLSGREDIFTWWWGPGIACRGSRVLPAGTANGLPVFAQYKPTEAGDGYAPWALQQVEVRDGRITGFTFFLDTAALFPVFGLPARLERDGAPAG